jgi:hypothetical protein
MFDAYCSKEATRVLLGPRNIIDLHNTSAGIVVYFRCRCGHPGVVLWGPAGAEPRTIAPEPAAIGA